MLEPRRRSAGRPAVRRAALAAAALALWAAPSAAQEGNVPGGRRPRQVVPMDSARAALLYVSNRHEDHPQADFPAQIAAKARTDSIFAARSQGVMQYRKTTYKSPVDGMEIPVYLFAPLQTRGARAHAALVWVHGGVHGNWDQNYLPFIIEAIEKGYVVAAPEYRGSTGYGAAHYNAIDYGGKEVDDVLGAYDFLKTQAYVDPDRVGVMGWSHGGFITAHLLFRGQTPFQSGAAIVPVTNLFFRLAFKGPGYQRSFSTQRELQGLPFEKREEYVKRSPYYGVDSLRKPLLVHIASNDEDVNFEEARPLVDALIARKPQLSETKIYWNPTPGPVSVGHTFSRRVNRQTLLKDDSPEQIDSWNRTWAFLERTLRPGTGGGSGTPVRK
ncbi:MAG: alpha/beta hydrolase family protein [Gemmatirosa sp.]